MSCARPTTPPPSSARDTSCTPMQHASAASSADPVALLRALRDDMTRQVAAAKTRNGMDEDGPASPELAAPHSDVTFDDEEMGHRQASDEEADEALVDGLPKAIAELREANAAVLFA